MTTNAELLLRYRSALAPYVHPLHAEPISIERGEGSYVWDVEGRRYLERWLAYRKVRELLRRSRVVATRLSFEMARGSDHSPVSFRLSDDGTARRAPLAGCS